MRQRIYGFVWEEWVLDKLAWKHAVEPEEVEESFFNQPYKVRRTTVDKYVFYGRSNAGRYLFTVFVWEGQQVKVLSACDMTKSERQSFSRK